MIIGVALFGIFHGSHGRGNRDFRHCYPNIQQMIIDPLRRQGHVVKLFVSTYPIQEEDAMQAFGEMVNPEKVIWCEVAGSSQYTTKTRLFECLQDQYDLDVIIYTRIDIHYTTAIDALSFDFEKFNFLFREKNHWHNLRLATDNIYAWPHRMTPVVRKAIDDTIATNVGRMDTHNLYNVLLKYISEKDIHFVSDLEALSDVNEFYSICRKYVPNRECLHPDVRERWKDDLI